jgi:hypothetical protein
MAFATSPSVRPDHSVALSSMFISHEASWAQMSIAEEVDARSMCSRQDSAYPSKMHWVPEPFAGVTVRQTLVIGSKVPSPTNWRSPAEVRLTGSRSSSVPGWSELSSTSSCWIAS